jgi:hypothetical protein
MRGKSKKRKARTASQQRWLEAVGELFPNRIVHHAVGETARHNRVPIGQEWIIPVSEHDHRRIHANQMNDSNGVHIDRKEFEKWSFLTVLVLLDDHPDKPSPEVVRAIGDYHL